MGSGGRGESLLFPDQDNGFVLADYPDAAHGLIDPWFVELAARMTRRLDAIGMALCRGGVMAVNPVWRKTLSQWRAQVELWTRRRVPQMLLSADILLDFRCVYGEGALSEALRAYVTQRVRQSPRFLFEMFGVQMAHAAGLGWFGRFVTERRDKGRRGQLEIKLWGTLPLAEAVRLMAMREGVPASGTLDRIAALRARDALGADEADALTSAYGFMTGLQLRQQLADYTAGRAPGNYIDPAGLLERERATLRASLRSVEAFRRRLEIEFKGAPLG
jgi:signal-transduction protein with cAMP-binding, CBS, and nucleotidyltransferase domain